MDIKTFIGRIEQIHSTCDGSGFVDTLCENRKYVREFDKSEYANEINNIQDNGLKYLLEAIIDEIHGGMRYKELYEMAENNGCVVASYKLATMRGVYMNALDTIAAFHYYKYYKATNDLKTFFEMCNCSSDDALIDFM